MKQCSQNFTEELDYEATLSILLDLAGYHAEKAGPYAADLLAKVAARDAVGLAGHTIDHSSGSPDDLYHARQCRAFFEKLESLEAGIDREVVAWEKFIAAERTCALVNKKFQAARVSGFYNIIEPEVVSVLLLAQRNIADCLGSVPTPEQLNHSFGPGANTSVKARASSARWKLDAPLTCSTKLGASLQRWLPCIEPWLSAHSTPLEPDSAKFCWDRPEVPSCDLKDYETLQRIRRDECQAEIRHERILNAIDQETYLDELDPEMSDYDSFVWEAEDRLYAELHENARRWNALYREGYELEARINSGVYLAVEEAHHGRIPGRNSYQVDINVDNGKLQFVPKSYKTHRSIIVEPLLNSFFQKGVGKLLKARLRKVGVDLADQSRNKALARASSLYDHLSTVDLSSASDTISKEIVYELLPVEWASLLDELRTATVEYKGQVLTLNKWSSMGNAYTFELESLIFWGLSKACCQYLRCDTTDLAVYGDDIIVPVVAVGLLKTVFESCGFTFNTEKTFTHGQFRESCGGDYVLGFDIRPYYQKHLISARTLFSLHNYYVNSFRFDEAANVLRYIPEEIRIWGPAGYGDGHLVGSWHGRKPHHLDTLTAREIREYRKSPTKWTHERLHAHGWEGTLFDTFVLKPKKLKKLLKAGDKLLPCYSIYVTGGNSEDPLSYLDPTEPSDHTVVRGWKGYRRMSIYTLSRNVFVRDMD